ncbi:MAG: hypothetical protein JNK79_03015 [Chitinophagaceae bacterium]|nr:hypothetical protein [Chitinophagaceae bacterium]
MKLSSLFAKYLYQHKQLRLPGIGVFTLDPSVVVPDVTDKLFADFLQNIRFNQQTVNAPDEDFINYIRTETGKIKPLAESDLESFLSDGKILLNIGKPFQIEGIGYLQKTREGTLEFKPGEPHLHKQEVQHEAEEPVERSKTFYLDTTSSSSGRKLLIALGAIAGIVIVIWGGYKLYNRNGDSGSATEPVTTLPSDTMAISTMPDSLKHVASDTVQTRSTYKFVIERTAYKSRALRRYNQLVENQTSIKMDTKDSTVFNLYFVLPATPADTARIRDSLKIWYARPNVYVE